MSGKEVILDNRYDTGDTCIIARDIVINDEIAFTEGDRVTVERIAPYSQRPECRNVVFSKALQKRFRLRDGDLMTTPQFSQSTGGPSVLESRAVSREDAAPQAIETKERSRRKTSLRKKILISSGAIALVGVSVAIIYLLFIRQRFPSEFKLGTESLKEATVKNLVLEQNNGNYRLTGTAFASRDGGLTVSLLLTTEAAEQTATVSTELVGNTDLPIDELVKAKGRIKKCELSGVEYQPYEFTSGDYPVERGYSLTYYCRESVSGPRGQSQLVPVHFTLAGPWDFAQCIEEDETVDTFINPAENPDVAMFPGATSAIQCTEGTETGVHFYEKGKHCLKILGSSFGSSASNERAVRQYIPPKEKYRFPFVVGDSWESSSTGQVSGSTTQTEESIDRYKVVSRNSIEVPEGAYDICYLLQHEEHYTNSKGAGYT